MTNRIRSFKHLSLTGLAVLLLAGCPSPGETKDPIETEPFAQAPTEEWELVWSDEFDGDSLNEANWNFDLGDGSDRGLEGWGNREEQWYTTDNVTVSDGTLKITALTEEVEPGFPYTSSRITTKGKVDVKYGRIEASIKAPGGQGMWSAFWMLPTDSPYAGELISGGGGAGGWAATGEIDIMEGINPGVGGSLDFTGATIYHGFPWPLQQTRNLRYSDFNDSVFNNALSDFDPTTDFNLYAVEWEQNELRFFVNDTHIKTINSDGYYSYYYDNADQQYKLAVDGAPFDTEFHIILNLAVGGIATGEQVDPGVLPGVMEIDYVRVYRCSYNLPDGSGCNVNVSNTIDSEPTSPNRPTVNTFDLYIDEATVFTYPVPGGELVRPLQLVSFFDNNGALTFSEVAATNRGTVIEVDSAGGGNISLFAQEEPIQLQFMGNNPNFAELHAGELRFDLLVKSADAGSEFLIKMDSGFPALGQVALAADDFTPNTWTTISVKVNDLIAFRGEGFDQLNTQAIQNIFVFEPTGAANVQIDNITLSCGIPGDVCGIRPPTPPRPPITGPWSVPGIWVSEPAEGSFGVGPVEGEPRQDWFVISAEDVVNRICYFDDQFVFNEDGSFSNVLGDQTWLENWQSGLVEGCGTPVSPHDGLAMDYTWAYDDAAGTMTLSGVGAYLGIPKAVNGGELDNPANAPASVTYNIQEIDNNRMQVTVNSGTSGAPIWWTFNLLKIENFGATEAPERTLAGGWQIAPEAAAFGVGPGRGDVGWFANSEEDIATRNCFFDDIYSFDRDGTFENLLGAETWLETWQAAAEECGTPVAPHDNSGDYTWAYDEGTETVTITGIGGYLGIPKAVNDGELGSDTNPGTLTATRDYLLTWIDDNTIVLDIESGAGVWWTFKMVKTIQPEPLPDASPAVGTWRVASEAAAFGVGPGKRDVGWFANSEEDITTRSCFFDDDYVFNADGSFDNVLGDDTWLETWQAPAEECGTPVAPHDGSGDYTWEYDEGAGTITISGIGGYLGIPKAVNDGELGSDTNPGTLTATRVYEVEFLDNNNTMIVDIESGGGVWWTFKLVKQ